jgi:hypothetical protein
MENLLIYVVCLYITALHIYLGGLNFLQDCHDSQIAWLAVAPSGSCVLAIS